jgi:hypothetical protein
MNKCKYCEILLTTNNWTKYNLDHSKYICNNCCNEYNKKRYVNNKEKIREQQKKYELNNKKIIIEQYGGKCICCGESHLEFLTIDHINNDGANERKITKQGTGGKLYRWLIKNNFPKDNYQLLCYNCNCSKGFFGYCPHQILAGFKQLKKSELDKSTSASEESNFPKLL